MGVTQDVAALQAAVAALQAGQAQQAGALAQEAAARRAADDAASLRMAGIEQGAAGLGARLQRLEAASGRMAQAAVAWAKRHSQPSQCRADLEQAAAQVQSEA